MPTPPHNPDKYYSKVAYAYINKHDKPESPLFSLSKVNSSDFCQVVIYGFYYLCECSNKSIASVLKDLRHSDILVNYSFITRVRNGRYNCANTLSLSFLSSYFGKSIIDLYIIGEDVVNGVKVLKRHKLIK